MTAARPGVAPRRVPLAVCLGALAVGLVLTGGVAVSAGSVTMPLGQVWGIVVDRIVPGVVVQDWTAVRAAIVWDSRLPRVVLAAVVGAALALAGAVAQTVTRNPLADPYLLGVSGGAGLAVVVVTVFGLGGGVLGMVTTPVAAFAGGLAALVAVLAIGGRGGAVTGLVLAGVAVGQICWAATSVVLFLHTRGETAKQVLHWLAGGLGDARWSLVWVPLGALVAALVAALASGRALTALLSGDDAAAALGVDARLVRRWALVGVSLVAGAAVAVAGGIGFVGLLVPHAAAHLVGGDPRRLLPTAALLGALFLVLADLAARVLPGPGELPVGVVTALVGGPAFAVLLARSRRRFG